MLDDFIVTNRDTTIARTQARVALRTVPTPTEVELKHGIPIPHALRTHPQCNGNHIECVRARARSWSRGRGVLSLAVEEERSSVSVRLQLLPTSFMEAFAFALIYPQ